MAWRQHQDDASTTGNSPRAHSRGRATAWIIGFIATSAAIDLLLGWAGLWQQIGTDNGPVWLRPIASLGFFSVHTVVELWQMWRVVTYPFVHTGIGDALPNVIALLIFGPLIEARLGTGRFVTFFASCALLPAFGHLLLSTSGVPGFDVSWPLLGATGGSLGMLAAAGLILPTIRIMPWVSSHTMTLQSLAWIMMGLLASMVFATGQLMGLPAGQAAQLLGIVAALVALMLMGSFRGQARPAAGHAPRIDADGQDSSSSERHGRQWIDRRRFARMDDEEQELDQVLDKIHQRGIESLSVRERRVLHQATMRMRQED